jgi:hypothetical protein
MTVRGGGLCALAFWDVRQWVSAWVILVVCLGASAHATAAPIYTFTTGTATVTVTAGGVELTGPGGAVLDMSGVFVEFDDGIPLLVDFSMTITPGQMFTLVTPYGGYDEITIESAELTPGVGYSQVSGTDLGGGFYSVSVVGVLVDAIYGASFSGGPPPTPVAGVALPFTTFMAASIQVTGSGEFSMVPIDFGSLPVFPGETDPLVITADITWSGIVPEPGATILLGLGLMRLSARSSWS